MAWRTNLLDETSVAEQKVHVRMARKAADAQKRGGDLWWGRAAGFGGTTAASPAMDFGSIVRMDHPEDFILRTYLIEIES